MINLTNSFDHPNRPGHTIFKFYTKERADLFEKLLAEDKLFFETEFIEEEYRTVYFYGVKNRDLKDINKKNYLVSAQYRKPIIPNVYARWAIIAFSLFVISLAFISYIKQH
jgi:hypothetical protein